MKQVSKILMIVCVVMMALSSVVQAGDNPQIPADNSSPELQKIKSLAGRWVSTTSMFGKKNQRVYTEYQVTSGGSAVLEKIFPGTPHEMISVYYDNKGKLAMTHYCMMRNRPTMKLASSNADTITMDVVKVDGLKSKKDPSMGAISLHFKDKNHFSSSCNAKGKGKESPMTMEYTRVR